MKQKESCGCTFENTEHGSYLVGQPVCKLHKRQSSQEYIDTLAYIDTGYLEG